MDYRFGCARTLYQRRIHPRVLLGPRDIDTLRRRIRSSGVRELMDALRAKVRILVERVLSCPNVPELLAGYNRTWTEPGTKVVFGLADMAMVAVLDDDAQAEEAVRRCLIALPAADPLSRREDVRRVAYSIPGFTFLAYDLLHPRLSPKDRRTFTRWTTEVSLPHILRVLPPTRYLKSPGGNMALGGMSAALTSILAVQGDTGVPSLTRELDRFISYLEATLHVAINPGGYPEEDVGYGTAVVGGLAMVVDAVRRAGLYDAYAQCPRYARVGQAILHFVQPWGAHLSNTGDHGDGFGDRAFILARLAEENRDPTLLWLLSTLSYDCDLANPETADAVFFAEVPARFGIKIPAEAASLLVLDGLRPPRHPSQANVPTQFMDPGRGIVTFRNGWKADDTFVIFDGSQRSGAAQGHAHASGGNFSLSAQGEYFAIDCGRYCNEQDQHNIVLVRGRSGFSHGGQWRAAPYHGILTEYRPDDFCDFAAADYSHQSKCIWSRRSLGFVKGQGTPGYVWIVDDVNHENDYTTFWWAMNTHPHNTISTFRNHATVRGCQAGNLLDVHFVLPPPEAYPKPHRITVTQDVGKCSANKYVNMRTAPRRHAASTVHGPVLVRPRLVAKVRGYNGRFMSVLVPRACGERAAAVKALPTRYGALAVRVSFPQVTDVIIFTYENQLLEADGVVGRGRWVAVRRSRKTGRVIAWTLGHGTSLEVDGRRLFSGRDA